MVDRFLSPPTILTHPLTLQSTIPPFFQQFFVFILASSGFTPFFDPPTAVKEQQGMQDVGSDSGDTFGYLSIPSSRHSAVDTLTHWWGVLGGPPDTWLIRGACYGYLKDKTTALNTQD